MRSGILGVQQQKDDDGAKSNVYSIIQGALWCKGYSTGSNISQHFYNGTGSAIKDLKTDMGIGGDSSVEITAERLATLKADGYRIVGRYKVGIYASRNICTRIIEAGCARCAFVSDMSTGFSGNLGFPILNDWVYDQFTEIGNYKGQGRDLASTMSNIQDVMGWNPGADLHAVCEALVGQDETYLSNPGIANLITGKYVNGVWRSISNSCNRDDLCCDGDAIRFAQVLSAGNGESAHLLS